MTQEGRAVAGRRHAGPGNTPRLRLKPKAPPSGYVDGAWWPRSDDLVKELPDLLAVLSVRLGAVTRVMYNPAEWAKAPPRLLTGERAVRLEGHGLQTISTLEVLGVNRKTAMLLVVPPQTDPDHAHETMMTAAAPDNASTVDDLLMVIAQDRRVGRPWTAVTEERWTAEDGTIR
jgi:hypothetical protein